MNSDSFSFDPIRLEVFNHLFSAIAEEMGVVLRKTSYSPNIKERRDYSCALFDCDGHLIAQAAHIPVHLGSMPLSVQSVIAKFSGIDPQDDTQGYLFKIPRISPGDTFILNDPFMGGTHLPDITLVTPVFVQSKSGEIHGESNELIGYVASRAHHADVGGMAPGSMPVAREIYQEGLIIPPVKIFSRGKLNQAVWDIFMANVRTPEERTGDLWAQIAANHLGSRRLIELACRYSIDQIKYAMRGLLFYTERVTRTFLDRLPDGKYSFEDYLDDDGIENNPVKISVTITVEKDEAVVDFTGSSLQRNGSINAVFAITLSAVYFVFRSLLSADLPDNTGLLVPIHVKAPPGTVVNARPPAPVAGGNVETSQRIVDVLLGALSRACPERIPAASQGTMNNVIIGGWDMQKNKLFTYYETIAGGVGARPASDGPSGVHSHMTNTLNTPVEALEYEYPLRVRRYEIRHGSGGEGLYRGGDGLIRELEILSKSHLTLLTERRKFAPFGLAGGRPGKTGKNILIRNMKKINLPGKGNFELLENDILIIETPGGGGFGRKD